MNEFALVDEFVSHFPRPRSLVLGPGDDAAIFRARGDLVVTVDAIVEGVHFTRDFAPEDIGHKALAVNLSDLAAMGAQPLAFVCALALPKMWLAAIPKIARGMAVLAKKSHCELAGGNVTRARELSITITAFGTVAKERALRRDGARVGDRLLVSGELGGAAASLRNPRDTKLRIRQRRPNPRIALGLAAQNIAHAAIDISDGLVADLAHVLDESRLGARIDVDRIPVARGATLADALAGGEDYELLFAVPRARAANLHRAATRLGTRLTEIGEIARGRAIAGLPAGKLHGHDHFRGR